MAHQGEGTQGEAVVYPGIKPGGRKFDYVDESCSGVTGGNPNDNGLILLIYPFY